MIKGIAWLGMTALALAVAGYASAMLFAPEFRPSFARVLFTERPVATLVHLASGAVALAVGAFQVNSRLRARFPEVHRWLGRLYVIAVVIGGVAAFSLALRAFGGLLTHLGFSLLAVCWIGSTLSAYHHIRGGNRSAHQDWMLRSYALTLAAVTLRVYLPASQFAGVPFEAAYRAISWLCWVPNLLIVEWFMRSRRSRTPVAA